MAPAKRVSRRTPSPASPHPFRVMWSGIAAILLLVLSIPMFVGAVQGQQVTSPLGSDTLSLIAALGQLGEQVSALRTDVQALRTAMASGQQTGVTPSLGEGMPECLFSCRSKLSQCLSTQASSTAPLSFVQLAPIPIGAQVVPLDKCRTAANTCMNSCRPQQAGIVSCEDRCAVALGGCLDAANGNQTKIANCKSSNQQCLIVACLKRTADAASMNRIPMAVCGDQCDRDLAICRTGAALDQEQLNACDETNLGCVTMCGVPQVPGTAPSIPSTPTTPATPTAPMNVQCENDCTAKFDYCRKNAGSDAQALSACDATYGSCRQECLQGASSAPTAPMGTQPGSTTSGTSGSNIK